MGGGDKFCEVAEKAIDGSGPHHHYKWQQRQLFWDGGEWKEDVRYCRLEWWEERRLTMVVMAMGLALVAREQRERARREMYIRKGEGEKRMV